MVDATVTKQKCPVCGAKEEKWQSLCTELELGKRYPIRCEKCFNYTIGIMKKRKAKK